MNVSLFSVEGKVAVVTGSSRGIGRRIALSFADAGASVVAVARSPAELETVAAEIRSRGETALAVPTDVTSGAQVSEMVRKAVQEFGRIDVLVNCAGGGAVAPLLEMSEKAWDEMLDRNLKSVYLCSREVGAVMVGQRCGSIINFSSGAATRPVINQAHYCASKAAVNQLTRVLAVEWGPFDVRVNAISPGLIDTSLSREVIGPARFEKLSSFVPLRRAGEPRDIVGLAVFLASEASAYISGVIIPVAGGPE